MALLFLQGSAWLFDKYKIKLGITGQRAATRSCIVAPMALGRCRYRTLSNFMGVGGWHLKYLVHEIVLWPVILGLWTGQLFWSHYLHYVGSVLISLLLIKIKIWFQLSVNYLFANFASIYHMTHRSVNFKSWSFACCVFKEGSWSCWWELSQAQWSN